VRSPAPPTSTARYSVHWFRRAIHQPRNPIVGHATQKARELAMYKKAAGGR
jgi:hypothetical protein